MGLARKITGNVFICHSKNDHNMIIFMNEVCANAGVCVKEFEFNFSAQGKTSNDEIVSIMNGCSVLFVLLGQNVIINRHTSNWVCSEVGLAKGKNIPIWIIEDRLAPVDFPIPFVDHYFRANIGSPGNRDPSDHQYLQALATVYGSHNACSGDINIPNSVYLKCNNSGRQAVFAIHQPKEDIYKCPVCSLPQKW